jgi:hypothetical protein
LSTVNTAEPGRFEIKREEKYFVFMEMSRKERKTAEKMAWQYLILTHMDPSRSLPEPGVKTVSGQVIKDCRPENQYQGNPEIFFSLTVELPFVNILQDDEHQADVDDKSQQ